MLNPELNPKRKSLEMISSPQNQNLGISINPKMLSVQALENIVRSQIFSAEPREIIIGGDECSMPITISWPTLQSKRDGKQLERFLSDAAATMKASSEILIRITPEGESNLQEKDKPNNHWPCIEKGVIIKEITFRKPSNDLVEKIIRAQAKLPNRVISAKWQNLDGEIIATTTLNPNTPRTDQEIQELSIALCEVNQLTVQEILPL